MQYVVTHDEAVPVTIQVEKVLPAVYNPEVVFTPDNTHFLVKSTAHVFMYADNIIVQQPTWTGNPPSDENPGSGTDGFVRSSIDVWVGINNITINIADKNDLDSTQVELTDMGHTVAMGIIPISTIKV